MMRGVWATAAVLLLGSIATAQDGPRDRRLEKPKDYNGYFPWTPPKDLKEWAARKEVVRRQTLVSQGLWPMPPKTPLDPVVRGKLVRDGYTIEKVHFASVPGHYVTGSLYRPTGKTGKLPAILSPHGHWANGRFHEANDKEIERQLKLGAESTREGARHPLQARCAELARLGCVVFHFDMVGYADSQAIKHRQGFLDVDAELWLTNFMGLQTWNCVRSLDFLLSLPDVDPTRVCVTGASGGGTQTFMLCAIDERPAAAFPAVMVSTAMQGGCICENASYLRIGTGNIELAALWAPKPLGMAAADDWTKEIETKGLPELKSLYRLFGAEDRVSGKAHLKFPHNYNQVSREMMYAFFNQHLKLGHADPIRERPFVPATAKELAVFDESNPQPKDAGDSAAVRKFFRDSAKQALAEVSAPGKEEAFQQVVGGALRSMLVDTLPDAKAVVEVVPSKLRKKEPGLIVRDYVISRKGESEAIRAQGMCTQSFARHVVVWAHPDGIASVWADEGTLVPAARKILDADAAIMVFDAYRTGPDAKAKAYPVNAGFAGYTFGYNRPLVAERAHDLLRVMGMVHGHSSTRSMSLVGFGDAGTWALLGRAVCADQVRKTAIDLDGFRFESVKSMDDPRMLPGASRYGGMPSFARLAAGYPLLLHRAEGTGCEGLATTVNNGLVRVERGPLAPDAVVEWLMK